MAELIVSSSSCSYGVATTSDVTCGTVWGEAIIVDSVVTFSFDEPNVVDAVTSFIYGRTESVDSTVTLNTPNDFKHVDVTNNEPWFKVGVIDVTTRTVKGDTFTNIDSITNTNHRGLLPAVEVTSDHVYSNRFNNTVDVVSDLSWGRVGTVDIAKSLNYGYSINNFIVGGSTNTDYLIDEEATIPPPEPPPIHEVITFVNVINVVVLPERTAINFTNLTLATDIDSVAWVLNLDVADQVSLDLIKPQGLTVKEVEVDVNGLKFVMFIGRTSTSLKADENGKTVRRIKCTGWSTVKKLSYPYSAKRSHVETSSATPSGLLVGELSGTGFTGTWNSVSWTIPADVFGYIDKTPLAAISELAQSVGAIIVPDLTTGAFTVEPRYPISPWDWSTAVPDRILNEASFFSMDTEWIPAESPDSIYVYGEEKGVGVKCVRNGTAGLITLPDVVDKHITDTIAGTERGRIEVAKNGHKENIPVTTYVDENGIIMPQMLVEVNAVGGGVWYGMVTGVALSLKRNGNAIVQSVQIERHYE